MQKSIFEILKEVSEQSTPEKKADLLRQKGNGAVQLILKYALDPTIKWLLPKGDPPFKPNPYPDQHGRLHAEAKKLYLYIEGGNPDLTPLRRETLFIQLLEGIDPEDAKLLCMVKDKKLPFKGLTAKVVNMAFNNLITEEINGKEVPKSKQKA